jgi:hypothetical protein
MKRFFATLAISLFVVLAGAPAFAAPYPALPPASNSGIVTGCSAVGSHNVNASEGTHQAQPAQERFSAVGEAFGCSG